MLLNAVSWTGAAGDNLWTTATNWFDSTSSTQHVPTSADDVTITASAGAIQITSGTQSINNLSCDKALTINGGTLSLATTSTINGPFTLSNGTFSGGTLTGAGDVTLNNASNSWTGGTMSGSGTTIIGSSGSMNLVQDPPVAFLELSRNLENEGTINVGYLDLTFDGVTIQNDGTIRAYSSAFDAGPAGGVINNAGEIDLVVLDSGTSSQLQINGNGGGPLFFNNSGNVLSDPGVVGNLQLMGCAGGTETGSFMLPTGSLAFQGGTFSISSASTVTVGALIVSSALAQATFDCAVSAGRLTVSGKAVFDSPVSVSGINEGAGSAVVTGGELTGTADVTFHGTLRWPGGTMTGSGKTIIASGATLNITGTGATTSTRPLEIDGQANLVSGGDKVLVCNSLTIGPTGKLDLNDNAMILDYTGASPISTIQLSLSGGYANGAWNGNGIMSSTAASTPNRTLGFAEASDLFTSFPATFAGQSIDNTSVLVRYTVSGDANLDQVVNVADLSAAAKNWQQTGKAYSQGDFNYDGKVDLTDLKILANNWNKSLSGASMGPALGPLLTTFALPTLSLPPSPPPPPIVSKPKTSSISGSVFNDFNRNKKRDKDESGLAGWRVFIDSNGDGILDDGETSVLTDAKGNWALKGLLAGTHTVRVASKPHWTGTTAKNETLTIKLKSGEKVTHKSFGQTHWT